MKSNRAKGMSGLNRVLVCIFGVIALWYAASMNAQAESPVEGDLRMQWWREARFGMFIHWGPVSLKGTEIGWSRGREVPIAEYDQLYRTFNPTNFSAAAWVNLAKITGMKYLVLTSKHHDGFCLWDSKETDYDIMSTPFHRDVVRSLADECKKQGIVFCLYHSIADWHHSDYIPRGAGDLRPEGDASFPRYVGYLKRQLEELLTNYGPLGILWFDGEWEKAWTHEHALDLDQYLRKIQPSLIINNRIDKGRKDMEGTTSSGDFLGDYDTPEQQVGKFQNNRPWESCITLCQQWAWKPNDKMKSLRECLQTLVYCAGGDGNLLLNIGPMPSGDVEPRQAERLREMGTWLQNYGKSIYSTRGGPFKPGKWGASTYRGNRVYIHVFGWPDSGLILPGISKRIVNCTALTGGTAKIEQSDSKIHLTVPRQDQREDDTVIELEFDGPVDGVAPVSVE